MLPINHLARRTHWRAGISRAYATSSHPGTSQPVRKVVVPKPTSSARTIPDTTASGSTAAAASPTRPNKPVAPASSVVAPRNPPPRRQPLNPASPEYKKAYNQAARRWTAGLIALPIFIVTSYVLFNRREFDQFICIVFLCDLARDDVESLREMGIGSD